MKINSIEAFGLKGETPKGGWANEIRPEECVQTLVLVYTDSGVTGIGSVFQNVDLVKASLKVLESLYSGENALEPDRVAEKLHQHMFWLGRGGAITNTISGISIALWDILGKATGQPVGRLLGGRCRNKVRPYASLLMEEDTAILSDKLAGLKEKNYTAFKIGWGPFGRKDSKLDEKIVRQAREDIGPDLMLMVDAGGSDAYWKQGYKWALYTSKMLADYGVAWFEEALRPDDLDDFILLRNNSPVPISGGEVLTRRQSFFPWIEKRAFDIIQPDVTKVGGIGEQRRLAYMAEDYGVRLIPHGWNTAIGLATDLQFASAFQGIDLVEYLIGSPYVDGIVADKWALDSDGFLHIPEKPGLGIKLDEDAVKKYTGEKSIQF
jgi:L-alanine-DL-glutamate epimerase-like enolase superfamily enzyme